MQLWNNNQNNYLCWKVQSITLQEFKIAVAKTIAEMLQIGVVILVVRKILLVQGDLKQRRKLCLNSN